MPIVKIDPEGFEKANVVQLDSDAPDNDQAMLEMEAWAVENGFARTNEYWLRKIITADNKRVYRGICYRLTREEADSGEAAVREMVEATNNLPRTEHQVD
jgi:hypothetical protein